MAKKKKRKPDPLIQNIICFPKGKIFQNGYNIIIELSVFVHYNEILRFRRGKMYGWLTMYAIFVDGFEMQALNHVCILHLIWSWVRP